MGRWPLPVVTGLCVAAFIGLAVGTAIEPTILLWTEGPRSYQLYSSTLSGMELIQLAELLR